MHSALNLQPSTLISHLSTLNPNPHPSTLNPQPSILNPQPCTLSPQPCTLNPQPSQPPTLPQIVVDGANVAWCLTKKNFSVLGLERCLDWFVAHGYTKALPHSPDLQHETTFSTRPNPEPLTKTPHAQSHQVGFADNVLVFFWSESYKDCFVPGTKLTRKHRSFARSSGREKRFSVVGLERCLDWFVAHGYTKAPYSPSHKEEGNFIELVTSDRKLKAPREGSKSGDLADNARVFSWYVPYTGTPEFRPDF